MPFRRLLCAFSLFGLLVLCGCPPPNGSAPRKLNGTQIADRAEPATVSIVVEVELTAEVPTPTVDDAALRIAAEQVVTSDDSAASVYRKVLNVLLREPERFLTSSSNTRTGKAKIPSQGSGVIFTADGYIATNAHVIEPSDDELKEALVNTMANWVEADVTELEEAIHRAFPRSNMTDEAKDRLIKALAKYYLKAARLSDISPTIFAVMGYDNRHGDLNLVGARCELKKLGDPIPGKDVAILKMDGANFPTLPLATSLMAAGVRTGADLYVVGFPGAITTASDLTLPSRFAPSQTIGHVSAIKDMEGGWQMIQTDTAINPGNSGGPAINDQGQVIGLATSKLRGQEGINFIISVDVVQEFVRALNLKPDSSKFTQKYLQALNAYEGNQRTRALTLFQQLSAERPGVRSVENFITQLQTSGNRLPARTSEPQREREVQPSEPGESPRHQGPAIVFGLMAAALVVIVIIVVAANR